MVGKDTVGPKMWATLHVVLVLAVSHLSIGSYIFDVTTIYELAVDDSAPKSSVDISTYEAAGLPRTNSSLKSCTGVRGHVHSRTNALGMTLVDQYDKYIDSINSEIPDITCDPNDNKNDQYHCGSWELNGGELIRKLGLTINNGEAYEMKPNLTLEFRDTTSNKYLYFTNGPGNLQHNKISFLIKFYGIYENDHPNIFYNCHYHEDNSYFDGESWRYYAVPDRDGSRDGRIYCKEHYQSIPVDKSHHLLTFSFSKNELQQNVKIYRGEEQVLILDWNFGLFADDEKVNFFSVSTSSNLDWNLTTMSVKGIGALGMTSSVFQPQSNQLCLAITFHSSEASSQPQLEIYASSLTDSSSSLLNKISTVEEGLNRRVLNVSLENLNPIKLTIKQVGSANIYIARIASCNIDGEDVVELSSEIPVCPSDFGSLRWSTIKSSFSVYKAVTSVFDTARDKEILHPNTCWHGGVSTSAGCACTPGFTGSSCENGCGRNSFGQDCGGLCSLRQECQGLLMCTEFTGCQCAPGFTGNNCTLACLPGWYGNDCSQQCGNCAGNSPCDIYTGECTSCEQGYLPPHCKQVSVYYGSKPDVTSPSYTAIIVSFDPKNYITVDNPPQHYEIQYREKGGQWVVYTTNRLPSAIEEHENENIITERIELLQPGTVYQIRVVLIDANFLKYEGDLVQVAEIVTRCDIPTSYDYKVAATSGTSSIEFSWKYITEDQNWCTVERFEVKWKEGWKWNERYTTDSNFTLIGLVPGVGVEFKLRAVTTGGLAPYSKTIYASSHKTALSQVRKLRLVSSQSTSIKILWEPPRGSRQTQLRYTISYKCVDRPACSPGCQNVTEGHLIQDGEATTLSPLLPFTKYLVTVNVEGGDKSSIYVGTTGVLPTEVPKLSTQKPVRTNTSVTVYWGQEPVCTGYMLGYNYQLTMASDTLKILASGFTKETKASFHNLTASTDYIVKVFVVTVAGWNPLSYLTFNISTSATVPEAVRNLTVYKRGRSMLGLRWVEPQATYGQLKSFTVTYSLGQDVTSHTVELSRCAVWPDLYCHTIEGLRSNRRYNITVSARNIEVSEDGEPAIVTAITKESTPTAPVNVKLMNSTSTSIVVQWDHPNLANGVLRSFLVSVEETEKYDQESCCQDYPLVETSVKEESQTYFAEVSGLHPASTYYVSVSAKTVGLGPSQSLVVSTRPPHLPLTSLPRVEVPEVSWLPQDKLPEVKNSEIYTSLVRAHLLLAMFNETQAVEAASGSGIIDTKLDSLLQHKIGNPFYFIAEYNQGDVVDVSGHLVDNDFTWGCPPASLPPMVMYQLVAVQVLEYNSVYNVDLRYSQPFTLA